jgi:ATP-binding cassette subfamily F protein 3
MSLIHATNLSKSFGSEDIFSDISLSVPQRARIGMVGPNGVGKTTLLRILLGLEDASSGKVVRARGIRIGYLPQEAALDSSKTLWDECLTVFIPLIEKQKELAALEHQMSESEDPEQIIPIYGRLQAEFEALGGYTFELRIRQTLIGLGFDRDDEQRPVTQLSGGQRTRAYLAKLLLDNPDLLLLDEPTNHLDIQAVEWLEDYLSEWDGGVLLVSHDRYFLDRVVNTIWEMTPALEVYRGNYSAFLMQREERYERALVTYQSQQEFIEKEEEYIRRNMAGQNTRQAQGRLKRLERLLAEARLAPPQQTKTIRLKMQTNLRAGDLVLRTYDLKVGYQDDKQVLFEAPDLLLKRGECAAVIGPNGAGKTTFLKTLLEQIPPLAGEVRMGASLKIGYFAQAHEGLKPELTLMQEIEELAPRMLPGEVRDYLAKFLFTGDDVYKTVDVLSGGERGRMALARLAMQGANLLLLDEPTNHLDLPSQEILQRVLAEFGGTILLVSHDRYLIDALATQIWEVLPAEHRLRTFKGTYSEYHTFLQQGQITLAKVAEPVVTRLDTAEKGLSKHQLKRLQEKQNALEEEITKLEWELADISRQLENPPADAGLVQKLGQNYLKIQKKLDGLLNEWGELGG